MNCMYGDILSHEGACSWALLFASCQIGLYKMGLPPNLLLFDLHRMMQLLAPRCAL